MTNPNEPRPDHGEFKTKIDDETPIIAQAIRQASGNVDGVIGCYWLRIVAKFEDAGRQREIIRMWGVDLINRTVTVVETEADVELSRRQRTLSEAEIQTAMDGV